VEALPDRRALVRFRSPQRAVTPGQQVAFYAWEEVLGAGTIAGPG
jgi:tRNA U34 2-thiouridine synthase MnmA/TrmU